MTRTGAGRLSRSVFWCCAGVIGVTYVGFPVGLLIRGALRPRPIVIGASPQVPSISVIIAAHDEAASIGARLDDLVGPDRRGPRLEVIVASDGSSDATARIVAGYADRGV
ncbi:MAG: glycosyltransferase, partial [Candidatus Limnocylindrales bacterium]